MKYLILGLSALMMVGLIIGLYIESPNQNTLSQLNQFSQIENSASVNEPEETQNSPLQPVTGDEISYSLQNDELNITYNYGDDWVTVPIEKDLLFEGEYQGSEQELIDGSYVLTDNRAAFLYSEGADWESKSIMLTYSTDQGETWQDSVVTEPFSAMRFRKVDFLNDQFGYVIISGGRTMSSEYSTAFLTNDGGNTWEQVADPPSTRLIADGGFVDEMTGFLSYGTINPEEPELYVTQDSGNSWTRADFNMPENYDPIFVQAEVPVKEEDHLSVLVNQGPNGDYQGGMVKGKFVSEDNGLTWEYSTEVEQSETEY